MIKCTSTSNRSKRNWQSPKKKTGVRLLSALLCGISFLTAAGCQPSSPSPPDSVSLQDQPVNSPDQASAVIRTDLIEYGPYIYVDGKYIRRYNQNTNLLSPACVDPECQGTCPLETVFNEVIRVVDDKMFFYSWQEYTHITRYGYQDLISGDIKVLVTLSELEETLFTTAGVWEDYMYYSRKHLREGGDSENPDDYISHVCRVSVDSGKEEILYAGHERVIMVADDKVITTVDDNMYSYDLTTRTKQLLFNLEDIGYKYFGGVYNFLNGKLYFICVDEEYIISEYTGRYFNYRFLLSVDIHTGEVERVVEEPVISYALTDDTIYYFPFELRHLYVPEDDPRGAVVYLASPTLYACDISGENQREVYTSELLFYADDFTVVGNTVFAYFSEFDRENCTYTDGYWGCLDLDTKEIIPADVEEHPGYRKQ